MASDFRTAQEQKLWDQLSKELDDVEKLSSPASMTKALGTMAFVASRVPMTAENERSLRGLLGKLRDSLNRSGFDSAIARKEARELTSSVRTFVATARVDTDKTREASAQLAVKEYHKRIQGPLQSLRRELVALRATTSDEGKLAQEYKQRESHLLDSLSQVREIADSINAGIKAESAGIVNVVALEKRLANSIQEVNRKLSSDLTISIDTSGIPRPETMRTLVDKVDRVASTASGVRASQVNIAEHVAAVAERLSEVTRAQREISITGKRTNQAVTDTQRSIVDGSGKTTAVEAVKQLVPALSAQQQTNDAPEAEDNGRNRFDPKTLISATVASVGNVIDTAVSSLKEQLATTSSSGTAVESAVASLKDQLSVTTASTVADLQSLGAKVAGLAGNLDALEKTIVTESEKESPTVNLVSSSSQPEPNRVADITRNAHVGLAAEPKMFQPDTNNMDQYEQGKVDSDRRTFLSLFGRLVDNVAGLSRGNADDSGGFLKSLFATLGLGKLMGWGSGQAGKKGLMAAIGTGVAAVASKLGKRFSGLFTAAGTFAARTLGPSVMSALKFVLKRGVFAVPVIGTLLGSILMASDSDVLSSITGWLGPTFSTILDLVGGGLSKIGDYIQTDAVAGIVRTYNEYAPAAIEAARTMMQGVNEVLYKPFKALQEGLATYAEKWKDVPVLGSMMRSLNMLFNDPSAAGKELLDQVMGSSKQNMDSLNLLLKELGEGKGVGELSAVQDVRSSFNRAKEFVGSSASSAATYVENKWGQAKDAASSTYTSVTDAAATKWDQAKSRIGGVASSAWSMAKDAGSSLYSSLEQASGALYGMQGGVNVKDLQPSFANSLLGAFSEYQQSGGQRRITLTSGFRSLEDQERLYKEMPGKAAPPGRSLHQFGLAVDADRNALGEMDRQGILAKHGLERPFASEPWHVQPIGLTDPAAKAGIFSSDYVPSQGRSIMFDSAPGTQSTGGSGSNARLQSHAVPAVGMSTMKTSPPPVAEEASGSSEGGGRRGNAASQSVSVDQIPKYLFNDSGFMATNLGVLAQ